MRIRTNCYLVILLILCAPIRILWADSHDSVEADFFEDAPLILTASRMSKPLIESPASVSVIDREMIQASGVREIADLFRLVPGFVVGYHRGNTPVVTYHGLGQIFSRQIQVLIDGRSVFVPSFGGIPWSSLPVLIEDIERIEVIRGPNAVTYGANAFLATINIITRHAAEDLGVRYSLTSSDNSHPDIKDAYVRVGYHHGDLDWRLSAGTMNDDGFASINDSKEIEKVNFKLDLVSGTNQFWTVQLGTSNGIAGLGLSGASTNIEREKETTNSYLNLLWEGIRDNTTSTVRLTHTRQEVIDNFTPPPFDLGTISGVTTFIDFDRLSNRTDIELIQSRKIGGDSRIVYGGSFRRDKVKSIFLFNDDSFHDVDTSRLFSAIEWRINVDWLVDFGATIEDSSITSRESSPRLSVIRKLGVGHALRFVASRAKRNPILHEFEGMTEFAANVPGLGDVIVPTWQGNNQVIPENIDSYEIGLRSKLVAPSISSDIRLFSYEISDLIANVDSSTPDGFGGFVETAENLYDVQMDGIELSFDYAPTQNLKFRSGFSLLESDSNSRNLAASFPERTAFLNALYNISKSHEISASYYYVDEMEWADSSNIVPSINKLDFRYAYLFDSRSETQIELVAQNLLEEYEDYEAGNFQERTIFLRFSSGF